mgnify:CR=1 FL=1
MIYLLGTDKNGKCCNRCGKKTPEGTDIPPCDVTCSSSSSSHSTSYSSSGSSSGSSVHIGCMNPSACNYDPVATYDPGGLCVFCSETQYCFAGTCLDCACTDPGVCASCPTSPCCFPGETMNTMTCTCEPIAYGGCIDWVAAPPDGFTSCENICTLFPVTYDNFGCCNCI